MVARALPGIERGWWGVDFPGRTRSPGTYTPVVGLPLPPIERVLDDALAWLREQPVVPGSLVDDAASSEPTRFASEPELNALLAGRGVHVPVSFATFVGDPDLRRRIRSCTACYLDLGDVAVPAPGGWLIHFLSDQQWVLQWLLFVGDDGSEAVLATETPYGFAGESPPEFRMDSDPQSELPTLICAESFNEFVYRFWIENELWFALADPDNTRFLTDEQRLYAERHPGY